MNWTIRTPIRLFAVFAFLSGAIAHAQEASTDELISGMRDATSIPEVVAVIKEIEFKKHSRQERLEVYGNISSDLLNMSARLEGVQTRLSNPADTATAMELIYLTSIDTKLMGISWLRPFAKLRLQRVIRTAFVSSYGQWVEEVMSGVRTQGLEPGQRVERLDTLAERTVAMAEALGEGMDVKQRRSLMRRQNDWIKQNKYNFDETMQEERSELLKSVKASVRNWAPYISVSSLPSAGLALTSYVAPDFLPGFVGGAASYGLMFIASTVGPAGKDLVKIYDRYLNGYRPHRARQMHLYMESRHPFEVLFNQIPGITPTEAGRLRCIQSTGTE